MSTKDETLVLPSAEEKSTTRIYLLVCLLSFPLKGLLYLIAMILYKDLHATTLQITTMIALKPIVSLLSPYWSQHVHAKRHLLISNIFWANFIKFFPFLIIPFFSNPWFIIITTALYMFLHRGIIPAWMEILKSNLSKKVRSKTCAAGTAIDYVGGIALPLTLGVALDNLHEAWRWLFPLLALIALTSCWFIKKIPTVHLNLDKTPPQEEKSLIEFILAPWKSCVKIFSLRGDFFKFQIAFFLGGAGLMIIQPALPKYLVDVLDLSYKGMFTAIAAFNGIGFALTTPMWVKFFHKTKIFTFCAIVCLIGAAFPLLLIGAQYSTYLVYAAYFMWGSMQGGSTLSWKMSGPVFSNTQDSSPYSSINILTVGIRGLIFPYLGAMILTNSGPQLSMLVGGGFCIAATFLFTLYGKTHEVRAETAA